MFAPATLPPNRPAAFAGAYRQVGVETGVSGATPHHLVVMLFDGFSDAIIQAKAALSQGRIEAKCKEITRAVRIVDEGLKAPLDVESGGDLARNLSALYAYVALRLTHANLHNDADALDECLRLLEPVRSAWLSIAPPVGAGTEGQ